MRYDPHSPANFVGASRLQGSPPGSTPSSSTAPHRLYVLDVDDLTDDERPSPRYRGWRILLEVNRRAVAIATTVLDQAGRRSFGGIATGPAVASVVFAMHVADELVRTEEENFVIAALDIPALHLVLLQLSNADASRLAFLPIGLASGLHPAHLYSRTQTRAAACGGWQSGVPAKDGGRVPSGLARRSLDATAGSSPLPPFGPSSLGRRFEK